MALCLVLIALVALLCLCSTARCACESIRFGRRLHGNFLAFECMSFSAQPQSSRPMAVAVAIALQGPTASTAAGARVHFKFVLPEGAQACIPLPTLHMAPHLQVCFPQSNGHVASHCRQRWNSFEALCTLWPSMRMRPGWAQLIGCEAVEAVVVAVDHVGLHATLGMPRPGVAAVLWSVKMRGRRWRARVKAQRCAGGQGW